MKNSVRHTLQRLAMIALLLTTFSTSAQKESPEAALNDLQSDAYVAQKKGEAAEKEGNLRAALDFYEIALETYTQVQAINAKHETKIITYRIADLTEKKAAVSELIKETGGPDPEMVKKHERLLNQYERLVDEHQSVKDELAKRTKKGAGTDFTSENLKLDNLMLKEKVAELARKVGASDPETANKIRVLEEQIAAHRSNSERLQKMVGDLTRDRDTIRSQMAKTNTDDEALKAAQKSWDTERKKLAADLAAAKKAAEMAGKAGGDTTRKQAEQIKQLETTLAKTQTEAAQARTGLAKATEAAAAATDTLKKQTERVDQLDGMLVQARTETMKARTDAEAATKKFADLGPDAQRAGELRAELNQAQAQVKTRDASIKQMEKQLKDNEKEAKKVQASIGELQKLSDRNAAHATEAQNQVKELKLAVATLENEHTSYVAKLKEWEKNGLDAAGISDEVRKKLASFSGKETEWTQKNQNLEAALKVAATQNKSFKSGLVAADKRMKELDSDHKEAAEQVTKLTQKLVNEIADKRTLGETYAALRKENASTKSKLASADRDRDTAVRAITKRHDEAIAELARVRSAASKSQADLKTLGVAHGAAQKELTAMKKADNPLSATVTQLEKQLNGSTQRIRDLETSLQDNDLKLATATQAVTVQKTALAQVQKSMQAMKDSQSDNGAAKALARAEKLNKEVIGLQGKLTAQQQAEARLKQELAAVQKQLNSRGDPAKKLADANKRLAEATSAKKQAEARTAESQSAIKRLEGQVSDMDKTIASMRKAPAAPKADPKVNAAIQAQLADASKRIAALEQAAAQHQSALAASERKRQAVIRVLDQKVREAKALDEKLKAATGKETSARPSTDAVTPRTAGIYGVRAELKKKELTPSRALTTQTTSAPSASPKAFEQLKKTHTALQAELKSTEAAQRTAAKQFRKEQDERKEQADKLTRAVTLLKKQLDESQARAQAMTSAQEQQANEYKQHLKRLTQEVGILKSALTAQEKVHAPLDQRLKDHQKEAAARSKEIETLKQELAQSNASKEANAKNATQTVQALQKQAEEQAQTIRETTKSGETNRRRLAELEALTKELNVLHARADENARTLSRQLRDAQRQREDAVKQAKELTQTRERNAQDHEKALATKNNAIRTLLERAVTVERDLTRETGVWKDHQVTTDRELKQADRAISDLTESVATLEHELAQIQAKYAALKKSRAGATTLEREQHERTAQTLTAVQANGKQQQATIDTLRKEVASLSADSPANRATQRRVAALEKDLIAAQKARQNADVQAAELSNLVKGMRERIKNADATLAQLDETEAARNQLKDQLNTALAALTILRKSHTMENKKAAQALTEARKQIADLEAQRRAIAGRLRHLISTPSQLP